MTTISHTPCMGKQRRSFNVDWLNRYAWMSYSHILNGACCNICILFGPEFTGKGSHKKAGKFVTHAFKNWKDVHERSLSHSQSQFHQTAVMLADNFIETFKAPDVDIVHRLDSAISLKEQNARKALVPIVKIVLFCGRQGLAFRGHIESPDSIRDNDPFPISNDGNFRALLRFRVDAGDNDLQNHLQHAPKNAQYTSPLVQNKIN